MAKGDTVRGVIRGDCPTEGYLLHIYNKDARTDRHRRRRARRARDRRAGGELAGARDGALAVALPAPVELGLGVHRDGLRALEPGPRPAGAAVAVRGAVGERAAAAHR